MKKNLFFAIAAAVMAMTACSESMLEIESVTPQPEDRIPEYFIPVDGETVDVIFDDESVIRTDHVFSVIAEDTIRVSGTEGVEAAEALSKEAKDTLLFAYNYNISNEVVVEGLTMSFTYEGVDYALSCGVELTVSGQHEVVESSSEPAFYELSKTDYVLSFGELELAGDEQVFVVEEGYIPPVFDHVDWTTRHYQFQRNAGLENDTISVLCNNFAEFAEVWSDGSRRSEETIPYLVNNLFKFNFPELNEDEVKGLNGKSVEFVNGVAKINDHQVSCTWIKANVEGDVVYGSKNYAGEIEPCKVAARTITFGESSATILFYNEDKDDYAKISVNIDGTPVMEDPVYNYTEWSYRHENFRRDAQLSSDNTVSVFCDNVADFVQVMSDNSRQNEESVDYTVVNRFTASVPEIQATADDAVVGKTYDFVNGEVTVCGVRISAQHVSAEVVGEVMYQGENYASEIVACEAAARTITFTSASEAVIRFYDEDSEDYAEATVPATVVPYEEPVTVVDVDWSYRHVSFQREATVSNNIINVFCDNVADFVQVMSDNSRQNEESVDYTVRNRFTASIPEIQATASDKVVGKTYDFVNGVVTVCGVRISAQHVSAEVVGEVMYQGENYASEIVACEAAARTITFISASEAVIRFYDHDSEDYAEVSVPVTVTPVVTVVDVARDYRHEAFRPQAVVANNAISVVCDNEAVQTTTMSDGTSSKASTNYTWTNRFVYSIPSIPASVKGQSFRFNAGTAVVEGYNVTVNFSSREVSAIMFDGNDYRSEAPVCQVNVATITFGEGSATITFEHDNETISATIPVDYIEAEIISGEIVGMWITDAYQGRTLTSTDLHILARNNDGSFVVYSRGVNENNFTTSPLSASEGQYILNSGMPLAWAYRTDGTRMLSLVDYIQSSKSNTGYVINYWNFSGQKLIGLGDAEAALNGVPFAEPLKAVGIAEDGVWSISYNGSISYFVGTIM